MRILIRGGTVDTATGSSAADVLIDGETVVAEGSNTISAPARPRARAPSGKWRS